MAPLHTRPAQTKRGRAIHRAAPVLSSLPRGAKRDRYYQLIARAVDAPKQAKLTPIEAGAVVALEGSTINIDQRVENYITNLRDTVAALPEDSPTFDKGTASDLIGSALKDVAKGAGEGSHEAGLRAGQGLGAGGSQHGCGCASSEDDSGWIRVALLW